MSVAIRNARMMTQGGIGRRQVVNGGGIFSSIVSGVKKVAGVALNMIPGPAGAIIRTAAQASGGSSSSRPTMGASLPGIGLLAPPSGGGGGGGGGRPAGMVTDRLAAILPGGSTGRSSGCASGFHPNKTSYFLKDGTFIEKGTVCVRNRRRNPLNPRALDRAMGRVASTGKALKSLGFRAPQPKSIAQKGKPKRRK